MKRDVRDICCQELKKKQIKAIRRIISKEKGDKLSFVDAVNYSRKCSETNKSREAHHRKYSY
jgi:hypothetical protein